MGIDFSNIKTTQYESMFIQALMSDGLQEWMKVTDVINSQGNAVSVGWNFGMGDYAVQVSGQDPTAQSLDSIKATATRVTYEHYDRITEADIKDNPEVMAQRAVGHAVLAQAKIASLVWAKLNAAPSTVHPGGAAGNGGPVTVSLGDAFFADVFTGPNAQGNLLTTALSQSSLTTARQAMRAYLLPNGKPQHLPMRNEDLLIAAAGDLAQTVYDLTDGGREGGGVSESGYAKGIDYAIADYSMDTNDWLLINRHAKPITTWIRTQPHMMVTTFRGHLEFYSMFECVVFFSPWEGGLQFSAVA